MRWVLPLLLVVLLVGPACSDGESAAPPAPKSSPVRLQSQVEVGGVRCLSDGATGRVTNNSASTVDIFIDVQFLTLNDLVLDDSLASVRGLRAGQSAMWDAPYLGDNPYTKCRATVGDVFER